MAAMDDAGELHLAVCWRFGAAVTAADGKWDRRSRVMRGMVGERSSPECIADVLRFG